MCLDFLPLSSRQCLSNLSSLVMVSETNKVRSSNQCVLQKKMEANEQYLLCEGQSWLLQTFRRDISPLTSE
jgi:hypothetical protein